MRRSDGLAVLAVLVLYAVWRGGSALVGPFYLPFETAFQEAIALHHLKHGFLANRFLPVIAIISGENFYHTAHPPLLHVIYALLYGAAGVHEWVTRFFSLGLLLGSALLWRSLLGREAKSGWQVLALAFFLPAPFLLGTTTNYEPLSIFMVSLIARLTLARPIRAVRLAPILAVGMLVDWPVYLAVPAVLVCRFRYRQARPALIGLVAFEFVFFVLLQGWFLAAAGECAFFSHAPERANPLALLAPGTWQELGSHFLEVTGWPVMLVILAAVFSVLVRPGVFSFRVSADQEAGSDRSAAVDPELFFGVFLALLILSAPRLVSRHYVYLLYTTPVLVFALHRALGRTAMPSLAFAALALLLLGRDYLLARDRNPGYAVMAERVRAAGVSTAFASPAVGAWYYYAGIETVHPVSAAANRWLLAHRPDLVHLDLRHSEVEVFREFVGEARDYRLLFALPGERTLVRAELAERLPRYLTVESGAAAGFMEPSSGFALDGRAASYGIREHPGAQGAALVLPLPGDAAAVRAWPAIVHTLPGARSDGVSFLAVLRSGPGESASDLRLVYARYLADGKNPLAHGTMMEVSGRGARELALVSAPGPRLDNAFDDAWWLEPEVWAAAPRR